MESPLAATPRLAKAGAIAWQLVGIAAVVAAACWLAAQLMPVLIPVAVALMLATLLRTPARLLERRGVPPAGAALLAMLAAIAVLAIAALVIVPPFGARLADLGASLEEGARRVAYSVGHDVLGAGHDQVDRAFDGAGKQLRGHWGGLAGGLLNGATLVASALGGLLLVVFLTFFLVKDGESMWGWLLRFAPRGRRDDVDAMGRRAWSALGIYVRGVVFVATVDAVLIGLALVLVGVPLALPLIVLTWVAAFFPIVGAFVAGGAAVLVALVANGTGSALVVLAAIVVVQQLEGNVLYPVVVGPRLRLHPVVVLLALGAGGTLAGIAGAFLSVPVATVGAAILAHARESRAAARPPERFTRERDPSRAAARR